MNLMLRLKNKETEAIKLYNMSVKSGLKNAYGYYCAMNAKSGSKNEYRFFRSAMLIYYNNPYRNKEDLRIKGGRQSFKDFTGEQNGMG